VKPFVTALMKSSAGSDRGKSFVSCRNDGTIQPHHTDGRAEEWMEGLGIATGIAF